MRQKSVGVFQPPRIVKKTTFVFFRFRISKKFDFSILSFRGVKTLIGAYYAPIWRLKLNFKGRRTVVLWTILAFSAKKCHFSFFGLKILTKIDFSILSFRGVRKPKRAHVVSIWSPKLSLMHSSCDIWSLWEILAVNRPKIDFGLKILKKVELFFWSLPNSCTIKNTSSVQIRALKVILRRLKLIFWSHFVWKPP